MALPTVGGGQQIGDGNNSEVKLGNQSAPATAIGDATLTVSQLLNGIILATPTAAAAYTLPTVATLEATLTNGKVDSFFDFSVINLASSNFDITMTTNTGWTITGGGVMVVQEASSARFRARKTGDATWQLYRL